MFLVSEQESGGRPQGVEVYSPRFFETEDGFLRLFDHLSMQ